MNNYYTTENIDKTMIHNIVNRIKTRNENETTVALRHIISVQESRFLDAVQVYQSMQTQIKELTAQLTEQQRINVKLTHEINSLKAYQYKKHNTPAKGLLESDPITETTNKSNKNVVDSQPEDTSKPEYANSSKPTMAQLKVLCDLWSKFEGIQLPKDPVSKEDTRLYIDSLMKTMHNRELVFRKIKYDPDKTLQRYVDKYSALIQDSEVLSDK